MLMLSAFVGMNAFVLFGTGYSIPSRALYTALLCGAIALCALWAFQEGLPISNGGSLFVVITGGVMLFKERLGWYGIAGWVLGTLALVLLSIS